MNVTVCNCSFLRLERGVLMVDEWSGLSDLLTNLIEKYASELDIDKLPDIEIKTSKEHGEEETEELRE